MNRSEVFVIGAGPAGLTAAYLLTKAGVATTVIEADPIYLGGISRTVNYKGFLFDIGGNRFFSKSKEVADLWHEILPQDLIERPRLSRIYYQGRYYSYPLKTFEALTNLGIFESSLCVLSFAYKQVVPNEQPVTFHDWVANHFGERLFSIFFKHGESVGPSCDEISADWAAQRIKGLVGEPARSIEEFTLPMLNAALVNALSGPRGTLLGQEGNGDAVLALSSDLLRCSRSQPHGWFFPLRAARSVGGCPLFIVRGHRLSDRNGRQLVTQPRYHVPPVGAPEVS